MNTITQILVWAIGGFICLSITIGVAALVWWYRKGTQSSGGTHEKKGGFKLPGWTWVGVMLVMWMFSSIVLHTCSSVEQGRSEASRLREVIHEQEKDPTKWSWLLKICRPGQDPENIPDMSATEAWVTGWMMDARGPSSVAFSFKNSEDKLFKFVWRRGSTINEFNCEGSKGPFQLESVCPDVISGRMGIENSQGGKEERIFLLKHWKFVGTR